MSSASAIEDKLVENQASAEEVEGEEEDEEDYAEEAEPILAYTRMKNDINEILQQDSVSCIKAGHRVNKNKKKTEKIYLKNSKY